MSNVFALRDETIHGEPDPDVVAKLEELLAMAKSGDMRGIAYV